jgi:ASC-1-like (ASCH) protein
MVGGGAFFLVIKYYLAIVLSDKYEGRFDKCVPPGTTVIFLSGQNLLDYKVRECVRFNCVQDALRRYGFARLVPDAQSIEDALVVYHKIALFKKGPDLHKALQASHAHSADALGVGHA